MSTPPMPMKTRAVMIDGPATKDRDDALWVTATPAGWSVHVHIANVADHIPAGSDIDGRARARTWSTYLPDRVIGMLPPVVERAATLQDDVPTLLIRLDVAPDGTIARTRVGRSRLHTAIPMTYEKAAVLRSGPVGQMLAAAHNLARVLLARRQEQGALAIYELLHGWAATEDGTLIRLDDPERNSGYVIVQELMIAANEAVARWAATCDVPILFRNHSASAVAPPRAEILDALTTGNLSLDAARDRLAVVMKPAEYAPTVFGHYGLNVAAYTHATSPLRRYADLATQRNLLAALDGADLPHSADDLYDIAADINTKAVERRQRRNERHKEAARNAARGNLASGAYTGLAEGVFHKVVKVAIRDDRLPAGLTEEIQRRATDGLLAPRDIHAILCTAPDGWTAAKTATLTAAAASPETAVTVVTIHGQVTGQEPKWEVTDASTITTPAYRARVALTTDDVPRESAQRTAPSKRLARQQAALSLLCLLAGVPDLSDDVAIPGPTAAADKTTPDGNPVGQVNELVQQRQLKDLTWDYDRSGPAHQPTFDCTVHATHIDGRLLTSRVADQQTKAAAKAAAATALLALAVHPVPTES